MSDPERDQILAKLDELNGAVLRIDRALRGDGETRTGILARLDRLERLVGVLIRGAWLVVTAVVTTSVGMLINWMVKR